MKPFLRDFKSYLKLTHWNCRRLGNFGIAPVGNQYRPLLNLSRVKHDFINQHMAQLLFSQSQLTILYKMIVSINAIDVLRLFWFFP